MGTSRVVERHPLKRIEARMHIQQQKPQLSVDIELFDPIQIISRRLDQPKTAASLSSRSRSHEGGSDESLSKSSTNPRSARVTSSRSSVRSVRSSKQSEEPQEVLYALSSKPYHQGMIIKKLIWDTDVMKYVPEHKLNLASAGIMFTEAGIKPQRRATSCYGPRANLQADDSAIRKRPQTAAAKIYPSSKAPMVDLSFTQAAERHNVIHVTMAQAQQQAECVSTTTPVIFNPDYNVIPPAPSPQSSRPNSSVSSVYKFHVDDKSTSGVTGRGSAVRNVGFSSHASTLITEAALSYEDILAMRAPHATSDINASEHEYIMNRMQNQLTHTCIQPEEGDDNSNAVNAVTISNTVELSQPELDHEDEESNRKASNDDKETAKSVRDKLRASLVRQVSMPSYAVMKPSDSKAAAGDNSDSSTNKVIVARTANKHAERTKSAIKPPYIPPSQRIAAPVKTFPTISYHGLEGDRKLTSFALPVKPLIKAHHDHQQGKNDRRKLKSAPAGLARSSDESGNITRIASAHPKLHRGDTTLDHPKSSKRSSQNSGSAKFVTVKSGYQTLDINLPTVQESSGGSRMSSRQPGSDGHSNDMNEYDCEYTPRSLNLDDVEEDNNRAFYTPPPAEEAETTDKMKVRVHQELLNSLADTQDFLRGIEERRKNRRPQIIYSDEEDDSEMIQTLQDYNIPDILHDETTSRYAAATITSHPHTDMAPAHSARALVCRSTSMDSMDSICSSMRAHDMPDMYGFITEDVS